MNNLVSKKPGAVHNVMEISYCFLVQEPSFSGSKEAVYFSLAKICWTVEGSFSNKKTICLDAIEIGFGLKLR